MRRAAGPAGDMVLSWASQSINLDESRSAGYMPLLALITAPLSLVLPTGGLLMAICQHIAAERCQLL
eukprot:scaffold56953_cov18-Prasinocladus_malaysianus.AAC.1